MERSHLLCSLALLIVCGANAMEPQHTQFFVREGDQLHTVKRHDVSPFLRNLSQEKLEKFVTTGNRIKAIRLSTGDFRLEEQGGLLGGGPGAALAAYFGIQSAVIALSVAFPPAAVVLVPLGQVAAGAAAAALAFTPTP